MSVWAEFNPLKSCVIGTLPNAEDILPHTKLTNRYAKYFNEILYRARVELDNLEKTLQGFGVQTHRSEQCYEIYNGKTISTPPLQIRDIFSVYGDNLFKGNFAFAWNKDVPASCDHLLETLDWNKTYSLPHNNIFYDGDFAQFDPETCLDRPLFHPSIALRVGNDIVVSDKHGKEGNRSGRTAYLQWIKSINQNAKIHFVDTSGHIDAQIFLVRPGLLLTSLNSSRLPAFFDKWEKIHVKPVQKQLQHKKNEFRHKKFHPVLAQWFYNFLETCTEETYFNLNSLSVDENTVLFTGTDKNVFNQLEKKGITCVPVSMKATTFWDTGVHCATNELERVGELQNYA